MQGDVKIGIAIGVLLIALIAIFWWARDETPTGVTPPEQQVLQEELPRTEEPSAPIGIELESLTGQAAGEAPGPKTPAIAEQAESPSLAPAVVQPPQPAVTERAAPQTYYVVQKDDNFHKIARSFYKDDSKWTVIWEANKDKINISRPEDLQIGTRLVIPRLREENAMMPVSIPAAGRKTHTVVKGETLSSIAEKYYGSQAKSQLIYNANRGQIKDPDRIREGMVLVIPPE